MSRPFSSIARNFLALLSANAVLAVQDPIDYLHKVSQKVSQKPVLAAIVKVVEKSIGVYVNVEVERALHLGQLAKAQDLLKKNPLWLLRRRDVASHRKILLTPFLSREDRAVSNSSRDVVASPSRDTVRVLAYLTNSLPFSTAGYAVRSHQSLLAMRESGITVSAVTRFGYPSIVGVLSKASFQEIEGIRYHRMLPVLFPFSRQRRLMKAVDMLVDLAKSEDAEVLLTTTSFENALVVSHAAYQLGIPWVYEMRGEPEQTWLSKKSKQDQDIAQQSEYYLESRKQECAAARAADAVCVLSEITRERLEALDVDSDRIYSVPNAVDSTVIAFAQDRPSKSELITELGLENNEKAFVEQAKVLIGTATSIVSYEGLDTLIDSLAYLPDSYRALIVGDGDEKSALQKRAVEKGIDERVLFVGRRPFEEMPMWYSLMDVFVIPRKDELVCRVVTPIKGLIAQALGIPVVVSNLEALVEVTGGFETYVQPEDSQSLARGILDAYSRGSFVGTREFDEWLSKRTWDSIGEEYNRLFTRLVK